MTKSPPDTSMPREEIRTDIDNVRARIREIREELRTLDSQVEKLEEGNKTSPSFERSQIEFNSRIRRFNLLEELGRKTEELQRLEQQLEKQQPEKSPQKKEEPRPNHPKTPESPPNNDPAAEPQAISAEARAVLDEVTQPGRPIDDILLKRPKELTAGEFLALKKATLELPQGPEQDLLDTMATRFLEATYGTGPIRRDAVGRLTEPQPLRPIPATPSTLKTADGEPLEAVLRRIGVRIAADAGAGGLSQVVLALQRGLNMLGDAPPPTFVPREKSKSTPPAVLTTVPQPIAEDGLFGPETRGRMRQTLARLGTPKVEEGMALGHFYAFAAGRVDPDGLDQVTERAFGPLFRSPKRTLLRSADRHEAVTLQETLNDLGTEAFGDESFEPLLLDGVIGPKTKGAFSRVRDVFGPERLTRRFGEFLGFL